MTAKWTVSFHQVVFSLKYHSLLPIVLVLAPSYEAGDVVDGVVWQIQPTRYVRIKFPRKTWGLLTLKNEDPEETEAKYPLKSAVTCCIISSGVSGRRRKNTWNVKVIDQGSR